MSNGAHAPRALGTPMEAPQEREGPNHARTRAQAAGGERTSASAVVSQSVAA